MSQSKVVKNRVCSVCGNTYLLTADEISKHYEEHIDELRIKSIADATKGKVPQTGEAA